MIFVILSKIRCTHQLYSVKFWRFTRNTSKACNLRKGKQQTAK